jgi:formylglycine-generating enzyme required for sulfatase activity
VNDAPGCEGGVPGLFHMSGHVWEWTDACDTTAADPAQAHCRLRGGSFWDYDNRLFCAAPDFSNFVRDYANKNHGFRCCADAVAAN